MKTKIKIGKKNYCVDVSEISDRLFKVIVDGEEFIFVKDESSGLKLVDKEHYADLEEFKESDFVCDLAVEKDIKSPIAGTVSKIYIKKGEELKPKQPVLILIAMKMENEIISETCGNVKEIKVKENQFVNAGDILVLLE